MKFSDTHCHLDFPGFDVNRDALIGACRASSVDLLIVPSVQRTRWEKVLALSSLYPDVLVGLGLHPYFVAQHKRSDIDVLESLLVNKELSNVVAVGEMGLDATIENIEEQFFYFERQLELAERHKMPVIIHSRKTHNEVINAVRAFNLVGGVVHAFSGSSELLNEFVRSGLKIGVGGVITWPSAVKTRDSIAKAPLESLVLETDSPDMKVVLNERSRGIKDRVGRFGGKSTPLGVLAVFEALCKIRTESPELIAKQLWENTQSLFFRRELS